LVLHEGLRIKVRKREEEEALCSGGAVLRGRECGDNETMNHAQDAGCKTVMSSSVNCLRVILENERPGELLVEHSPKTLILRLRWM